MPCRTHWGDHAFTALGLPPFFYSECLSDGGPVLSARGNITGTRENGLSQNKFINSTFRGFLGGLSQSGVAERSISRMGMEGRFQGDGKNGPGQSHSRTKNSPFPGNQPLARAPPTALGLVEKRTWGMEENKGVVRKQDICTRCYEFD